MKLKGSLIGFGLITCLYLGALIWLDTRKQIFAQLPQLWQPLLVMMTMVLGSFILRFARWQWLLHRMGHHPPAGYGFLAYLSGFAFTATPGKVGELVRIRYLLPAGVPAQTTLSVFVFERLFDLLAVLLLATLYTGRPALLTGVAAFVLLVAAAVWLCASHPRYFNHAIRLLRRLHARRLARWLRTLRDGLHHCRRLATPLDATISLALGLAAWLLTALAFVFLLWQLGISLPLQTATAIYPISMLAGAASMMPGGLGSTEATIAALLTAEGVDLATAGLAAVGIRLASLWFSILLGMASVIVLAPGCLPAQQPFCPHASTTGRLSRTSS